MRLDRVFHNVLGRRREGVIIRRYGVARFLRQLKHHIVEGGRDADQCIYEKEAPEIGGIMGEVLGTALYQSEATTISSTTE